MRSKNMEIGVTIQKFVNTFFEQQCRSPSLREIEYDTGISRQTIHRYLKFMDDKRILKYDGKVIRTKYIEDCLSCPLIKLEVVGDIPCGTPTSEEIHMEGHIFFPKDELGEGEFFALSAMGDSMIEAGIDDQDIVIVHRKNYAELKQIVVSLDEENRNTLKRLMHDGNRFYLHPENPSYEDIYPAELKVQGVAVKVIKNLT